MSNWLDLLLTAGKVAGDFAKKNKKTIIAVGVGTATTVGTGKIAYSKGHKKGKVEGTKEQARRDEQKMRDMHNKHEADRSRWKNEIKKRDDLLDELEKQC